ncbi:beta-N-acetylhexosaminidase [Aliidiomarina sp. Khilg15.8]
MTALMLDIEGLELNAEDKELLQHPAVGGVILFSRNYADPKQLAALCQQIRAMASGPVLIAIDHEGGRVQRCRDQFSAIPAMGDLATYAQDQAQATRWARHMGWLMASEVLACGLDFSFAPVLDVNGCSEVIGDRAFSADPKEVEVQARAFIEGMRNAGMAATGKHFPGHGSVVADSHVAVPEDSRELHQIETLDMKPFRALAGELQGIMPAHVIYSDVDSLPAGFSKIWLQNKLREQLGFKGVIFSDDLAMHGASVVGDMKARAELALEAGCDMILVCNDRAGAIQVVEQVTMPEPQRDYHQMMAGKSDLTWNDLPNSPSWKQAQEVLATIRTQLDR